MKKMNTLLTALAIVITAVTPVTSSAVSATPDSKSQITLTKNYASQYTITLPDGNVTLDSEEKSVDFSINAYLEYNEKLDVSVTSANDWKLMDSNTANENGVTYTMKADGNAITDENNKVVSVTSENNKNNVTVPLTFCDFGEAKYAGTYSDTLTFNVTKETVSSEETTPTTTDATNPADTDTDNTTTSTE